MTDADPPTEPPSDNAPPARATRPSQPTLGPRTPTDARPVRPSLDRAAPPSETEQNISDADTFAAPPRPPARRATTANAARSSAFASVDLRRTLIPPCLVLGVGCIALGVAYFRQPPDAALRQVATTVPIALLAAGGAAIVCAAALAWSVRRD